MQAKANLFGTLVVLPVVVLVAVAVALFGLDLKTAETQTTSTQITYSIQDLGTLGGSSTAADINASGHVVGSSRIAADNGDLHAFLYDESATPKMQDLGTLEGGYYSEAKGINDSGQVVGSSYTSENGVKHAFLYDESATPKMQDLNDLIPADSGWTIEEATAINSDGKIVANALPPPAGGLVECGGPISCGFEGGGNYYAALVLTPDTTATPATYEVQNLGSLGGSEAKGINDSGQVVGYLYTSDLAQHAFLYDESATPKMQDLGTLGGYYSEAKGINDSGQVVGYSDNGLYQNCINLDCWRAFLYDESATPKMQDLGTFESNSSEANGINDSGKVVGVSGTSDGSSHGFFKESGQPMIDLNTLIPPASGWTIDKARAINTDHKIAATGYKDGVGSHALLLTPVPDTTAPKVDSFTPYPDGVTRVSLSTPITATFSEYVDPNTLTKSTFTLTKQGSTTPLGATMRYDAKTATLQPSPTLNRNTTYTATVKGGANGVKDKAGNALASDKVWSFTTGGK